MRNTLSNLTIFIVAIISNPYSAHALLKGGLLEGSPQQLCGFLPIKDGVPMQEWACSALIVGKNEFTVAGHCGYYNTDKFVLSCKEGAFVVDQPIHNQMVFKDAAGPLDPTLEKQTLVQISNDIAVGRIIGEFTTPPLERVTKAADLEVSDNSQCYMTGVGLDDFDNVGLAHSKKVKPSQINVLNNNVIRVNGYPVASGHDSGGTLICDNKVMGTIVSANENTMSTFIATYVDETATWFSANLSPVTDDKSYKFTFCDGDHTAHSMKGVIPHIQEFTEIRSYLNSQAALGITACFEGLTLTKNTSGHFQSYIGVRFFDPKVPDQPVKRMALWFQNASTQGYNNVVTRPWVVIDADITTQIFANYYNGFKPVSVGPLPHGKKDLSNAEILQLAAGNPLEKAMEISRVSIGKDADSETFLLTWTNTVGGNSLHTTYFVSKTLVFKLDRAREEYQIGTVSSGWDTLFLPLNAAGKEYQEASLYTPAGKSELLESLIR